MSAHTPGPWTCVVGVSAPYVDPIARTIRPHYVVNQTTDAYRAAPVIPEDEARANARLIALAPELLAALTATLSALRCASYDADQREAALMADALEAEVDALIAKAEGR